MIIDCSWINKKLRRELGNLRDMATRPKLAILVEEPDAASESYVRSLQAIASSVDVLIEVIYFYKFKNLSHKIFILNSNPDCHGILLMENAKSNNSSMRDLILPAKDVEGSDFSDDVKKVSCTARACLKIMEAELGGDGVLAMDVVIVGYGKVVGKPLAYLLMRSHAGSVTTTHAYTENMDDHLARADIIVSAVGKPHFLKFPCHEEQLVIDAGMSKDEYGQLVGDVHPSVCGVACVSPVPGGVGPITSLLMLQNVILASIGKF